MSRAELPTISLVVPSFQQADYLGECLDSILSQNYPRLQLVVMDGGSSDGSVALIKRHQQHLHHWRSHRDGGQYAAINEGFSHTDGELMAWLNSDDKYHPDALFKVAYLFMTRQKMEWLTGRHSFWHQDGGFKGASRALLSWSPSLLVQRLQERTGVVQQESTFWRRGLWERAGELKPRYRLAADYELWCRFSRHADLYTADALLGGFRRHPAQKTARHMQAYLIEAEKVAGRLQARLRRDAALAARSAPAPLSVNPGPIMQFKQSVAALSGPEETDQ